MPAVTVGDTEFKFFSEIFYMTHQCYKLGNKLFILLILTAQKMKFPIKNFSSKYDQIRSFLWIWSHLLEKSLMGNFIFVRCLEIAVQIYSKNISKNFQKNICRGKILFYIRLWFDFYSFSKYPLNNKTFFKNFLKRSE